MTPRFQASADRALAFFKRLRIPDLPGKPTFAEVGRQWQFDFVAELFGGLNPETNAQAIREAFLCVAKKNYKTGIGAGVLLTAAHFQIREEDELVLLAGTVKAATTAFRTIVGMVKADEALAARYKVNNTTKFIKDRETDTTISVIALNNASAAGSRASFIFCDELWTMGEMEKAEGALQEVTGGQVSRPEGFVVFASTMPDKPPAGVFLDKLTYARKVKGGEIVDPAFLPVLYEPPPKFNWRKNPEEGFRLSNPNLGASVQMDWLMAKLQQVKDDRTGKREIFLSKHMNLQIGVQQRSGTWPGAEFWPKRRERLTLDDLLARCEVAAVGLDGGGLADLLGLCVLGRERDTQRKLAWFHAWCNPTVLDTYKDTAPRLRGFEADGDLTICDTGEDVRGVADVVAKVKGSGLLHQVGCDPYGLGGITEAMNALGLETGTDIVGVSQGWKLGTSIMTAERWLADGSMVVADSELAAWCAGNCRVDPKGNGQMITKAISGKAKIDTIVALFNACSIMSQNPPAKAPGELVMFGLSAVQ